MKEQGIGLLVLGLVVSCLLIGASAVSFLSPSLTCAQSVVHNDKAICAVYINKELKK